MSTFFFPLYNNNNNNNNNNNRTNINNNNNNNNNKSIIILYTFIGSYSFLCAFALNVIINTHFFKGSINLAA